jgi:ketosteroid isomerase-like protein
MVSPATVTESIPQAAQRGCSELSLLRDTWRAVSEETLELARRGYAAWSTGDLETMLSTLDEDVEFRTSGVFPGLEPVYRGHDGMRKFWEDFRSPWESLRIVMDHFRESGDQIVALYRFEAVGRDGLKVHREAANVITLRDGLAKTIEAHGSWETALEAAGLRE